jgi:FkbM family methyltransferase
VDAVSFSLRMEQLIEFNMYLRCYETRLISFLSRFLQKGDVVFDVGGHIGWLSAHFFKKVGWAGSIHAFEPVSYLYDRFCAHFQDVLSRGGKIHINNIALSECKGTAQMSVGRELNTGFNTLVEGFSREGLRERFEDVQTDLIDNYWNHFGRPPIKLLKIDVEGSENSVLRGAKELLSSGSVSYLMVEISPQAAEVSGLARDYSFQLLREAGYEGYILENGTLLPLPKTYDFWVADTFWKRKDLSLS